LAGGEDDEDDDWESGSGNGEAAVGADDVERRHVRRVLAEVRAGWEREQ
jgi:hypothetical protein